MGFSVKYFPIIDTNSTFRHYGHLCIAEKHYKNDISFIDTA